MCLPYWKLSRMWIICSEITKENWSCRFKSRLPDTYRNPAKSSPIGITRDNVKSWEKSKKSDSELSSDAVIIWKLSIGKSSHFPGS